ncbi:MAG: hypothetical protein H7Y31_16680 [Chitinophagaceae bacterium]|nr:hypothetical protein [Chitinophagaceae bacterium]
MFKKDSLKFGLLIGFIAPLLSMVVYYFVRFREFTLSEVFGLMAREKNQITAIVIPCLLLNILLFTFYVNTRRDQTAKGIFSVTLVFAIAGVLVKFLI